MESGIYLIESTINSEKYVGSSIDLNKRLRSHQSALRRGNHKSKNLQNHYDQYGDVFSYSILETCSKEEMISRENYWIDFYDSKNCGFNIKGRSANTGVRIPSLFWGEMEDDEEELASVLLSHDTIYWVDLTIKIIKKRPKCVEGKSVCEIFDEVFNKKKDRGHLNKSELSLILSVVEYLLEQDDFHIVKAIKKKRRSDYYDFLELEDIIHKDLYEALLSENIISRDYYE